MKNDLSDSQEGFNTKPEFVKGQRVLVGDNLDSINIHRYFSHVSDGCYYCFINGGNELSADKSTAAWKYCKALDE